MTSKIWTQYEIKGLLETNDTAVARAIVAVYNKQTASEQAVGETSESNGVGFNGVDANFLSSLAQFYQAKGFLSKGQLKYGRKKIMKYSKQLTLIANNQL